MAAGRCLLANLELHFCSEFRGGSLWNPIPPTEQVLLLLHRNRSHPVSVGEHSTAFPLPPPHVGALLLLLEVPFPPPLGDINGRPLNLSISPSLLQIELLRNLLLHILSTSGLTSKFARLCERALGPPSAGSRCLT